MNPIDRLVYVQWKDFEQITDAKDQLKRSCRLHQTAFQYLDEKNSINVLTYEVRDADYAVIWNGNSPVTMWAANLRKKLNKHCVTLELGWFPQSKYWHIDSGGLFGDSSLCGSLREPTEYDLEMLQRCREDYVTALSPVAFHRNQLPPDYVLVPLQLECDSSLLFHAPYRTSLSFIKHVLSKFPDTPIVFKTHPKAKDVKVDTQGRYDVFVVREGSFVDLVPKASLVYGQNSTTLFESALITDKVEAIGDCPLKHHKQEKEKLLACMAGNQVKRDLQSDMWHHIFGKEKILPTQNKKKRDKTVTVLTPSRNRPSIKLLEKWVRNQTQECCWIVSEDGDKSDVLPDYHIVSEYPGNALDSFRYNLINGLKKAMEVGNEYVAIMEDDVWYSPKYLKYNLNRLLREDLDMIGTNRCVSYCLKQGWFENYNPRAASMCSTVFHKSLIPKILRIILVHNNPYFDERIWREVECDKERFDFHCHLNLKNLPGTGGFCGHTLNNENNRATIRYNNDPGYALLKDFLGNDAESYIQLVTS